MIHSRYIYKLFLVFTYKFISLKGRQIWTSFFWFTLPTHLPMSARMGLGWGRQCRTPSGAPVGGGRDPHTWMVCTCRYISKELDWKWVSQNRTWPGFWNGCGHYTRWLNVLCNEAYPEYIIIKDQIPYNCLVYLRAFGGIKRFIYLFLFFTFHDLVP